MSAIVNAVVRVVAKSYQKSLATRLAAYGLKYEDVLVETEDLKLALDRIDPQVKLERERRIKRAFDISAKKKYIPKGAQLDDPIDLYIRSELEKAQLESEERAIINSF